MSLFVSYIIFKLKFESVSALRLKLHDDFGSMFLVLKILMLVILKENNT